MGDVVNLRMARKRKARAEREKDAERNRVEHGLSGKARKAAAAETDRASRALDAHRRDSDGDR